MEMLELLRPKDIARPLNVSRERQEESASTDAVSTRRKGEF